MILQHPNMKVAEGARLGRMVESHLQRLVSAREAPAQRNIGVARAQASLAFGAGTSHAETAMAIARGIHQCILGKN